MRLNRTMVIGRLHTCYDRILRAGTPVMDRRSFQDDWGIRSSTGRLDIAGQFQW